MERENVDLRTHIRDLEVELDERKREQHRTEKKLNNISKDNHALHKSSTKYEQQKRELEREVGQRWLG